MFCSFLFVLPSTIITNRMLELHGMKEIRNTKEKRVKNRKEQEKQKSRNISGMNKLVQLVNFSKLLAFQEISVKFSRFLELGMSE